MAIATEIVAVSTSASVTAKLGTITKTINFTVIPSPIASITLPSSVFGGTSASCLLNLVYPAGAGGDVVTLTGTGSWTVPATVTVPGGKTSVSFSVPTKAVSAAATATITAKLGTSTVAASTTVSEAAVSYLILVPSSIVGGETAYGVVSLNGPAGPSGDVVKLSGTGPWTLPVSVTVPAGQTGAFFLLTTKAVTTATTAKITATLGSSSQSASLTVTP